ncbi:MAG TPA: polysaccharide deacetylase family protein [Gammaproteobacteria bacterium]|nr:polysaccharide deacetylase family protein [Gammaproteobacteria bacterium]
MKSTIIRSLLILPVLFAPGWCTADAVVLIYHRFGEDTLPATSVRLAQFDAHLAHLAEKGFAVWPLEKIVTTLRDGGTLPDKTVAITIDDGFASVYTGAYPRLKARGFPFTLFLNTDAIDRGLAGYLTWHQVREMVRHGARVANHTASHAALWKRLPGEQKETWAKRVREDIVRAQTRLQQELGPDANEEPRLFAYPYGEYTADYARLVRQMGYIAFGQHSGAIARLGEGLALPRFAMSEQYAALDEFALKVRSLAFPVEHEEPWDPLRRDGSPVVLRITLGPSEANLDALACYSGGRAIPVQWLDEARSRFEVAATAPLAPGRNRYNCTAPKRGEKRFYWYSHPWIVP